MEKLHEDLINILYKPGQIGKKYSINELKRKLPNKETVSMNALYQALVQLSFEGYVYESNGKYRSFPKELGYVLANITINKHKEGIINVNSPRLHLSERECGKIKILPQDLHGALNGDLVLLKDTRKSIGGIKLFMVEKVMKRKDGLLIAEVSSKNGEMVVTPFSATLDAPLHLKNSKMKAFVEGERIVVQIGEKNNNVYEAEFIKSIGHKDDPDVEIKMIAIENGITIDFSPAAIEEANNIPIEVLPQERVGRLDLRDEKIVTIDGASTKDRDDAISLRMNSKGNYTLGVHIADVSHYVHPTMKLWDEALERGTSAYLVDTVIPMLPHRLSNGICSLNPNVDRLAFSCFMEITPKGQIINYDFKDTVINSKKAMTYEDVNEYLENGNIVPGYEDFTKEMDLFQQLSVILEKVKVSRGYVDFGSNDLYITLDENRKPIQFSQRENHKAQKIIENFMLVTGECAANYVMLPSPYRVHGKPDESRVEETFSLIEKSGIRVTSSHDLINGNMIQSILKQIQNVDEREIAANLILRSMKRAAYSTENIGHFGLGLHAYGQFTSPIRRAPDLVMHYNIRMQRDNTFDLNKVDDYYEQITKFCHHATQKEKNADSAERDVNRLMMQKYIDEHLGEKFLAHVTYINSKGIYVKTVDGIEGKLSVDDLEGDTFQYDERTNSYKGKKSKLKIKIGTPLLITALDTKREYRTINFGLEVEDFMTLKKTKRG